VGRKENRVGNSKGNKFSLKDSRKNSARKKRERG
jgi:hypothetical protein